MAQAELGINIVARNQAKGALKSIAGDIKGIQSSLGGVMKIAAGNFISSAAIASVKALQGAVTGMVGGLASASMAAADFNAQISSIGAVAGASTAQLGELKQLALDLGVDPNLKVSAVEAAQAIEMLARNGLKVPQIMDGAAKATVLLANATGADFATAADIGTDAMALFGIQAKDMITAVDGITSVTNNSKFSINDYRLALAQGGGVAATVGVEFDDFNTTIAAIAPLFGSGSDAGTSFKTFLQRLVPSAKPAREAMMELGLLTKDGSNAFFDASGNMKSMAEVTGILNKATRDLTEEQKIHYLSTIFGTDAMRAAAGVAGMTSAEFEQLQATMGKTSATDSAAQRMDNLAGDMEIFRSVVESLQIQIGDEFDPALRKVFQGLTGYLSQFGPQIVSLAGYLTDAFIVPGVDAFLGKMSQLTELMGRAQTISGGIFAALGDLTGGDVTIDASGLVTEVRWGDFVGTLDWSAYIFSIEWGDFVAVWNWEDKIAILSWGEFIVGVDWDDYVFRLQWSDYIDLKIDWNNWISEFRWGDYVATFDIGNKVSRIDWGDFLLNVEWGSYIATLHWGDYVYSLDWSGVVAALTAWGEYIENLTWDQFVTDLNDWGNYIQSFSWSDVVTPMSSWSAYIKELDWKNIVGTIVDWSTWIPALSWFAIIKVFEWSAFIAVLEWKAFVAILSWDGYVNPFTWGNFVKALDWAVYIESIAWTGFINKLEWLGIIDKPAWADYLRSLSWSEFITPLQWQIPSWPGWSTFVPDFDWPDIQWPGWSEFIAQFQWPTITWPGWSEFVTGINLSNMVPAFPGWGAWLDSINPFGNGLSSSGSIGPSGASTGGGRNGRVGSNANGTDSWRGGWTWVGEDGPELLNLPKGAQVLSNSDSKKMIGQLAEGTGTGAVGPSRTGGLFNNLAQTLGFAVTEFRNTGAEWGAKSEQLAEALTQSTDATSLATDVQSAVTQTTQSASAEQAQTIATTGDLIRVSAQQFAQAAMSVGGTVVGGVANFTQSFGDLLDSFGANLESALQKVPGLFGASQVTADQMKLAEMGIDQNFADDWLRRLTDEVMNGVDWEGVDIADAAKRAGIDGSLPAQEILRLVTQAWNDQSLFADKGNLDLFNMDAVQAELMRQQAQAAGQANILALFGITPEQAAEAGVSAGSNMRSGVAQGLSQTTGGGEEGSSLATSIIGQVSPDQFSSVGVAAVEGILAELGKPENGSQIANAVASIFADVKAYGDAFASASSGILNAIAQGFGEVDGIDMTGKLAGSMRKNLDLEESIKTMKDVGARILEYVFQGYETAARKKDWAYATVGSAPEGSGTTTAGNNAIGTSNWRGGMTWVGETGPELVSLPRGTGIYSNSDSMAMAAGGGGVNVTVNVASVSNDIDIQRLGYQIADIIQRRRGR